MEKNIEFLKHLDPSKYKHAANYLQKFNTYDRLNSVQKKALNSLLPEYISYIKAISKIKKYGSKEIVIMTDLLNKYFDFIFNNNYDNVFTAQSKFRPTIMEEFMFIVFSNLISDIKVEINDTENKLMIGGAKAYSNLFFYAKNLQNFVNEPLIGVNQKDQDFAIYRPITLHIENNNKISTNIPIAAIENKTYIDKTMLEGSIATAEKIKSGNPYSLFLIVTETYEVDLSVDPAYSRIDQIYVLRKCKRKDGRKPINSDVVLELFNNVNYHLNRSWSDIESKMKKTGTII